MRMKLSLFTVLILVLITAISCTKPPVTTTPGDTSLPANSTATTLIAAEVEATEFLGTALTPIKMQRNNALGGTQHLNKGNYVLVVNGLVDNPLSLSYYDLLDMPQYSKLMPLDCVEGWSFTAKWTGPSFKDLFEKAKVQSGALIAIFYTADELKGYSSLDLSYINDRNIIMGMKINDITLPDERGFPFQVVAESKFGYKWAKWITRIELSANTDFRGYWETAGYNNNADVNGPALEEGQ
jgi:DMSO/TMAO reductase YedYZ molybdopterin-dependent catalytic subunit